MEYEDIKKLIDDMGNSQLTELSIEFPDGIKISMNKKVNTQVPQQVTNNINKIEEKEVVCEKKEDYKVVKSPMVGTFYSKSSPTAEPFAEVGKKVKKGDILCIVESMKLMNEIESEYDGKIVEVCLKDGDLAEYDAPLFKIK